MKAKHLIPIFLFILFYTCISAQTPGWQWVKSPGDGSYDAANAICTDRAGNVYVTGYYGDPTLSFGSTALTNVGQVNTFITKYDPSGQVIWSRSIGGSLDDEAAAIAVDGMGHIYIAGFLSSPSVTIGTTTLTNIGTSTGARDIFIAQYDTSGNVGWAKSIQAVTDDQATSLAVDASGNVFIAGYFGSPSVSFGGTTLTNTGYQCMFIAKYNAAGSVLWAKSAVSMPNTFDQVTALSTDASGNVYAAGLFSDSTVSFGTVSLHCSDTSLWNRDDIFITKYDPSGNVIWARSAGGLAVDVATGIHTDAIGNIYISGNSTSSSMTIGSTTLTNPDSGINALFIAKYDSDGHPLWARNAAGSAGTSATGIYADADGNSYLTGWYTDTLSLGAMTLIRNQADTFHYTNAFVAGYDASGTIQWLRGSQGEGQDASTCVNADARGNIYVAGSLTSASTAFGSQTLTNSTLPSYSSYIYVAKLDSFAPSGISAINESAATIKVYPNPSSGTVYLSGIKEGYSIEVYNMLGQSVFSSMPSASPNSDAKEVSNYKVDLSDKEKGLYFYSVTHQDKIIQQGKISLD